ncbi:MULTISPECIES: MaoC/PaaZ C-terminal domain-containing protein [Sphingobium]|uniref:MaoC/PaaZ C-terminal domain-containing protein n=1 Tax=Sphingobium TaxID=165695 RepID=UPI00159C62C5
MIDLAKADAPADPRHGAASGASMALDRLAGQIGVVHHSDWLLIDQAMIDRFADATLDRQYIHVDPARAATTPLGGTIAHGFLTLSLLAHLQEIIAPDPIPGVEMMINYGLDKVRFINPVRSGSRIRLASRLVSVAERSPGQIQQSHEGVVEIEGIGKPALVATWLTLLLLQ